MKRMNFPELIKPSTRAFWQTARRARDYSLYDFLHGYVYGRWLYLYIGVGVGEHPWVKKYGLWIARIVNIFRSLFRNHNDRTEEVTVDRITFADTYHGKVVPFEAARELVTVNQPIDLSALEQVIPYKRATDIVLRNPEHIVALDCPCRVSRFDPCLPLDVCLIVGEPFASFVIEHHPERARWISQNQAVQILREENDRGHVHHAFFKDAMLGRFYAICNCCACCCGAMQAHRNGTPMLASSGYVCFVDESLCIGCEQCIEYCQFEAISMPNGFACIDHQVCMGCGVCIDKCDQGALSLVRDETKGAPLEILELLEHAAGGL